VELAADVGAPRRPIIVGEAPSRLSDPEIAFSGRSGTFLERAAGLKPGRLRGWFECVNLLRVWPGPCDGRRGSRFRGGRVARSRAAEIRDRAAASGRPVLVAGRRAAAVFDIPQPVEYLTWYRVGDVPVAVIPHPSGVNKWWNEPANRARFAAFMAAVLAAEERRRW
jgi:uracil-DNA glycosylase